MHLVYCAGEYCFIPSWLSQQQIHACNTKTKSDSCLDELCFAQHGENECRPPMPVRAVDKVGCGGGGAVPARCWLCHAALGEHFRLAREKKKRGNERSQMESTS